MHAMRRLLALLLLVGCKDTVPPFETVEPPSPPPLVFRYLDAGSYHACGITTQEQLWCWGYNGDGQLGIASTAPRLSPVLIPGDLRYRLVSGGQFHACGLTLAGIGYCWGNNQDDRLGISGGPGVSSPNPVAVTALATFQSIQSGRVHSCGVDLSQHAWCWGYNGEGEIGVGSFGPGFMSPPVVVAADVKVVATGGLHTCAISVGGTAFCWGYNASGQLGDASQTTTGTPTPVAGGRTWRTDPLVIFPSPDPDFPLPSGPFLAAGYLHTCAIADITVFCWGLNQNGQLGDGTRDTRLTPVPVPGTFATVTAGLRHTCALADQGQAWCWGNNAFGQLGDGTTGERLLPVLVSGGLSFAYLKAGDLFTCGVTTAGEAWCWGDNEYGQLGTGTTQSSAVPVLVHR